MTELAYLSDISAAYVRTFRARVVALPPGGVVLDRTYFYPTGGGQPSDRGTLELPDGARLDVVDVSKSGPAVVHRVKSSRTAAARPAIGDELAGTIDWERRHRHMRLHTAQHLLSARIFLRTGCRTRKASMAGTSALLELEGAVGSEPLDRCRDDLREAVADPKPVTVRHVPRSEWDRNPQSARSGLVLLPAQVDPVRVIEIEGLDVCPCGGTHLRTTAEIGSVTIGPPEPLGDGGTRVTLALAVAAEPTPPG
jgi:misacylated tRNA(Ala) deacylase